MLERGVAAHRLGSVVLTALLLLASPGARAAGAASGDVAAPCCGPVGPQGRELLRVLDAAQVQRHCLPRSSVDWRRASH